MMDRETTAESDVEATASSGKGMKRDCSVSRKAHRAGVNDLPQKADAEASGEGAAFRAGADVQATTCMNPTANGHVSLILGLLGGFRVFGPRRRRGAWEAEREAEYQAAGRSAREDFERRRASIRQVVDRELTVDDWARQLALIRGLPETEEVGATPPTLLSQGRWRRFRLRGGSGAP